MADNIQVNSSSGVLAVPVASDELTELNGQTVTPDDNGRLPQAQRIKIIVGGDGVGTDVSADTALPTADQALLDRLSAVLSTADQSPPLVSLDAGSRVFDAPTSATLLDYDGRVMLDLQFFAADPSDTSAHVELSFGGGGYALRLYHGGSAEFWTSDSVAVLVAGALGGTITYQTWAAG